MKERLLDIISILINWALEDEAFQGDVYGLIRGLVDQGYTLHEIDAALTIVFNLPDILLARSNSQDRNTYQAIRVFSLSERSKIDVNAQGYLLKLMDQGLLTATELEEVVNAAMCLDVEKVGIAEVQWLLPRILEDEVRSVLLSEPQESKSH